MKLLVGGAVFSITANLRIEEVLAASVPPRRGKNEGNNMPNEQTPVRQPTFIDLFAGAGTTFGVEPVRSLKEVTR